MRLKYKIKILLLCHPVKKSERTNAAGWVDWVGALPMCWQSTVSQPTGHSENWYSSCHVTCGHTVVHQEVKVMALWLYKP